MTSVRVKPRSYDQGCRETFIPLNRTTTMTTWVKIGDFYLLATPLVYLTLYHPPIES